MGSTPTYLLPYPELTDPADVPLDMKELADRLEAVFGPGSANGQVPVWDNAAKKWTAAVPPGAELGYAEKTSSTSPLPQSEATAATIATLPAITFNGTDKVLLELFSPAGQSAAAAGSGVGITVWDGATSLGFVAFVSTGGANSVSAPMHGVRRLTPSAGAHTYAFKAHQLGANATVLQGGTGGTGAYDPAFIRAIKV